MTPPPPGTNLPPKHIFGCIERQATLLMISCRCVEGTKKYIFLYIKKTSGDNFTHTPRHAPFLIATNFGTWGQVTDVINDANFYLNRSKGYALPKGVEICPSPLTWCIALTTVLALSTALYIRPNTSKTAKIIIKNWLQFLRSCRSFKTANIKIFCRKF